MKTTEKARRKRKPSPTRPHRAKHAPAAPHHHEHELQAEPEEGAGNNDERELPEELRNEAPATDKRPPTNAVPDRPQDPSTPAYKEPPNPHDRIVNN